MQPTEADVRAAGPVVVRDRVRPAGRRDVRLDHHEVGLVVEAEGLHVFVHNGHFVVRVEVPGKRGEPERGEQRVLDGPQRRTGRLHERRKDHLHPHAGQAMA